MQAIFQVPLAGHEGKASVVISSYQHRGYFPLSLESGKCDSSRLQITSKVLPPPVETGISNAAIGNKESRKTDSNRSESKGKILKKGKWKREDD